MIDLVDSNSFRKAPLDLPKVVQLSGRIKSRGRECLEKWKVGGILFYFYFKILF